MDGGGTVLGIGLLGCAFVAFLALAAVVVVALVIKRAARGAASKAMGMVGELGSGLAGQATGAVGGALGGTVLHIGQQELAKGWQTFRKEIEINVLLADPNKMDRAVLKLAQRQRGLLTPANLVTELGVEDRQARDAIQRLLSKESCRLEDEAQELYAFPAFMEKRQVKVCEYCDSVFEPDEAEASCLACGAQLKTGTTV